MTLPLTPSGCLQMQGDHAGSYSVSYGDVSVPTLVAALRRRGVDDCEVFQGVDGSSKVRSISLGAEAVIAAGGCRVSTGLGAGGMDAAKGTPGDAADMASRAMVMHDAVLEQLWRV